MPTSLSDWVDQAAHYSLEYIPSDYHSRRRKSGRGVEHAKWLLIQVKKEVVRGTKAHRWLAYAQSTLVEYGIFKLEDAKNVNKKASKELDVFKSNQLTLGM